MGNKIVKTGDRFTIEVDRTASTMRGRNRDTIRYRNATVHLHEEDGEITVVWKFSFKFLDRDLQAVLNYQWNNRKDLNYTGFYDTYSRAVYHDDDSFNAVIEVNNKQRHGMVRIHVVQPTTEKVQRFWGTSDLSFLKHNPILFGAKHSAIATLSTPNFSLRVLLNLYWLLRQWDVAQYRALFSGSLDEHVSHPGSDWRLVDWVMAYEQRNGWILGNHFSDDLDIESLSQIMS